MDGDHPPRIVYPHHGMPKEPAQQVKDQYQVFSPRISEDLETMHSGVPSGADPTGDRFAPRRKYMDIWASILFALTLAGFIVCAVIGIRILIDSDVLEGILELERQAGTNSSRDGIRLPLTLWDYLFIFAGSALLGLVLSLAYFMLLTKYSGPMIYISFVFQIGIFIASGLVSVFFGSIFGAILSFLFAGILAWVFISWRSRIPFSVVLLETVTDVISQYPATIITGIIGLIAQISFTLLWNVAFIGIALHISNRQASENAAYYFTVVYMLFVFFWTTQVIKNLVHTTVSGLFASYYFLGIPNEQGKIKISSRNPTAYSGKRALTTSFGSICFGSLIIAIIQTLRAIINTQSRAERDNNPCAAFCLMCIACILGLIGDILEYFNQYAFTQVAIYGKSYWDAAKSTWVLVKSKGIDAIINDALIGTVLGLGAFSIGMLGLLYGVLVVRTFFNHVLNIVISPTIPSDASYYAIVGFISFIVCAAEFAVLSEVINSGVSSTFVCLAEDPAALARTKPTLFEKIRQSYPNF